MTLQHQDASAARETPRRVALTRAATEIVRESGFGAATVKAITARAGMSPGLLYSYANGVEELLSDVFRRSAADELAAVKRAARDAASRGADAQFRALVDSFAGRALRGQRLAWALLVEPVGPTIERERLAYRRQYADLVIEVVEGGIAEGVVPAQDARVTAAAFVGAIGEALAGPLSPLQFDSRDPLDHESLVSSIRTFCLRAVGLRESGR